MSGHSKWATTKHKKAGIDAKRSKVFTKVAKLITIAARDGKSGDVSMNPSLRIAVDNAKAVSMPKDNIDRAIKRGLGGLDGGAMLEEILYEAYAPGGVAMLIECLTDNKNRALGEMKAILNKNGGSLASAGSVSYLFRRVGQIIIEKSKNSLSQEDLEMVILDSGAEDFSEEDEITIITCAFPDLIAVKKKLEESGVVTESSEIVYIPAVYIDVLEDKVKTVENILELLDDLDDVNSVYSNANI
ncbi:MAG: YebC/PmpR family DNA-binding transcriptional regulator [Candidatus Berkelbacteria bacterium]|nr:YebC/PmpR family DNA-binding transcriptional regulator [Candidatus Berkelbacteria bacterium]